MNSWSGTGRVAKEPDVRYGAQSQTAVGRFTLAVEKNYKKNKDDKANFISIVCFGKTGSCREGGSHRLAGQRRESTRAGSGR